MCRPPGKNAAYARGSAFCANVCSKVLVRLCDHQAPLLYFLSKIPEIVDAWKSDLQGKGRSKLASSIPSPTEHDDLFEEGWAEAVKREGDLDSVA